MAASIPTLKPLFKPSRSSIFRFLRSRKTTDIAEQDGDKVCHERIKHNSMPNALPSFLSYYLNTSRSHEASQSEQSDDSSNAAMLTRFENGSGATAIREMQNDISLARAEDDFGFLH